MQQFPDLAAVPCKNENKDIAWLGLGQHFMQHVQNKLKDIPISSNLQICEDVPASLLQQSQSMQSIMNNDTPTQSHNYNFDVTQPLGPKLLGRIVKGKLLDLWRTETYRNSHWVVFHRVVAQILFLHLRHQHDRHDMSKIENVCSPSSASHQPSTELRQDVGLAWQLLLCFRRGAIGVLVKQHPGLLSPR